MRTHITIKEMKQLAKDRSGRCISNTYTNSQTKLTWKCGHCKHTWDATPNNIKNGKWCPRCAQSRSGSATKLSLKDMNKLAKDHDGLCVSSEYVNARTKLDWKCKEGHEFSKTPSKVKSGQWCPMCGKGKKNIAYMNELAKKKKGKCLSKRMGVSGAKLKWECSKGHVWETVPSVIQRGGWCLTCSGREKLTIKHAKDLAKSRGGRCLSTEYVNARIHLKWECSIGHTWNSRYDNIRSGTWCPHCHLFIGEEIVRVIFEKLFKRKFPKVKNLDWLQTSNGDYLELDGYSKTLSLAFEHQGDYHNKEIPYFTKTISFEKRKSYDLRKKKMTKANGVTLITIPEVFRNIAIVDLPEYIVKECERKGFEPKGKVVISDIDINSAYLNSTLNNLKVLAIEKKGKLLSKTYLSNKEKLKWQCHNKHTWDAVPNSIRNGYWCPHCAGNAKRTINRMQKIAKEHGGECVSKEYVNDSTKLLWKCKKGHTWEAIPNGICQGQWCPHCSGRHNITLKVLQEMARKKGGKCLSKTYTNNNTKMKWECKEGHQWITAAQHIRSDKWCKKCATAKRVKQDRQQSLDKFRIYAQEKGGKCINTEYKGPTSILHFSCKNQHKFELKYYMIVRKKWCPKCKDLEE